MSMPDYAGFLFIGDPHLSSRVPGFRRDDYPRVALTKLAWCLDYAREHRLLPALLGDLFDVPRENANWLLSELITLLRRQFVLAVHGNHDCRENALVEHDSFHVLVAAGSLFLLDHEHLWRGTINRRAVIVGGSSWGQELPDSFDGDGALVVWMAHHDLQIPGYDDGRILAAPRPGIDLLINGHIHRRLEALSAGPTLYLNPGSLLRTRRSDASRSHVPSALRVEIAPQGCAPEFITVPHQPFEEVFHPEIVDEPEQPGVSSFVRALDELRKRRTQSGAGLFEFLNANLSQFQPPVAREILRLAEEVTHADSD